MGIEITPLYIIHTKIETYTFKKQIRKFKKQNRIILLIKMIPMLLAMKLSNLMKW